MMFYQNRFFQTSMLLDGWPGTVVRELGELSASVSIKSWKSTKNLFYILVKGELSKNVYVIKTCFAVIKTSINQVSTANITFQSAKRSENMTE